MANPRQERGLDKKDVLSDLTVHCIIGFGQTASMARRRNGGSVNDNGDESGLRVEIFLNRSPFSSPFSSTARRWRRAGEITVREGQAMANPGHEKELDKNMCCPIGSALMKVLSTVLWKRRHGEFR